MRSAEKKFFAIFINSCALDKWTFFMDFCSEAPGVEYLKESRLDTVRTASNQRRRCLVYPSLSISADKDVSF